MILFPSLQEREERTLAKAADHLARVRQSEPGDRRCEFASSALAFLETSQDCMVNRRSDFAMSYALLGWELLNCGRRSDALKCFDRAISLDPVNPERWAEKATALTTAGEPALAVVPLVRALELSPGSVRLRIQYGDVLALAGRQQEASASFRQVIDMDPTLIEAYDRLLGLDPNDGDMKVRKAGALLAGGHAGTALAMYDHLLRENPGFGPGHIGRARALDSLGKEDLALREIEKALAIAKDDPGAHALHGEILEHAGRFPEALAAYDRAIRILPEGKALWRWRARVLRAMERGEEALGSLDRALKIDDKDPVSWYQRGTTCQSLHRDSEALRAFEQALLIDPRHRESAIAKSKTLLELGDVVAAGHYLDKALEIRITADVLVERAQVSRELGEFEHAVEQCDRAIALEPLVPRAQFERGLALSSLGAYDEASLALAKHLDHLPTDVDALLALGECRLQLADWVGAISIAAQILGQAPNSDHGRDLRKRAEQGQRSMAVERASRTYLTLEEEFERPPTKEEAFARGIPFDLLHEVEDFVRGFEPVDLARIPHEAWQELEVRSHAVLEATPSEPADISLAAITRALPEIPMLQAKRLYSYFRTIVNQGVTLAPTLDPILETRARLALQTPDESRSVGFLSRKLKVGLHEACEIEAVLKALRGGQVKFHEPPAELAPAAGVHPSPGPTPVAPASVTKVLHGEVANLESDALELPRIEVDADRYLTQVLGHPVRPPRKRQGRAPRATDAGVPPGTSRTRTRKVAPAELPEAPSSETVSEREDPPGSATGHPDSSSDEERVEHEDDDDRPVPRRRRTRQPLPTSLEELEEGSPDAVAPSGADQRSATDLSVVSSPTGDSLTETPSSEEEKGLLGVSWDSVKRRRSSGQAATSPPPARAAGRRRPPKDRTDTNKDQTEGAPVSDEDATDHEDLKTPDAGANEDAQAAGPETAEQDESADADQSEDLAEAPAHAAHRRKSHVWRDSL